MTPSEALAPLGSLAFGHPFGEKFEPVRGLVTASHFLNTGPSRHFETI